MDNISQQELQIVLGLKPTQVTVLTETTGMSKLALSIALQALYEGKSVAFFSLDKPMSLIKSEFYVEYVGKDGWKLEANFGNLSEKEKRKLFTKQQLEQAERERLQLRSISFVNCPLITTIEFIDEECRKHIAKHDCIDLIIVYDIRPISSKEDKVFSLEHNRNKDLTAILFGLTEIAKSIMSQFWHLKKKNNLLCPIFGSLYLVY